jgi:hypothetical protein
VGERNPELGTYQSLNPEPIARFVDGDLLARKAISELVAKEGGDSNTFITDGGKYLYKREGKWVELSQQRVEAEVRRALYESDQYTNYMKQNAKFQGYDPDMYLDTEIARHAKGLGATRAYRNQTTAKGIVQVLDTGSGKDDSPDNANNWTYAGNSVATIYKKASDAVMDAFHAGQPQIGGHHIGITKVDRSYAEVAKRALEGLPAALQPAFKKLMEEEKTWKKGETNQQKIDRLNSRWKNMTSDLQMQTPTNLALTGGLGKMFDDNLRADGASGV